VLRPIAMVCVLGVGDLDRPARCAAAMQLAFCFSLFWQHAAAAANQGRGLRRAEGIIGTLVECRGDAVVVRQWARRGLALGLAGTLLAAACCAVAACAAGKAIVCQE
jgi:hypothetical protein